MPISWTKNGYPLPEVVSALQKEVRRGQEESAMYWALEMCPRYERYMWRRLMVILHEDIGIANPAALMIVPMCRALYFEMRKRENGEFGLPLTNAVMLMCRSQKSRIGCHLSVHAAQVMMEVAETKVRRAVPDYALDMHTAKGKALGRGDVHFLEEAGKLVPEAPIEDVYRGPVYERLFGGKTWYDWAKHRWPVFKGKPEDVDAAEQPPLAGIE